MSHSTNSSKRINPSIFHAQRIRTVIWDPRGFVGSVVVDELSATETASGVDSEFLWVGSPQEVLGISPLSLAVWAVEKSEDLRDCMNAAAECRRRYPSACSICYVAAGLGGQVALLAEVGASAIVSDLSQLQASLRTIIPQLHPIAAGNPLTEGLAAFLPWPDQSSQSRFGR